MLHFCSLVKLISTSEERLSGVHTYQSRVLERIVFYFHLFLPPRLQETDFPHQLDLVSVILSANYIVKIHLNNQKQPPQFSIKSLCVCVCVCPNHRAHQIEDAVYFPRCGTVRPLSCDVLEAIILGFLGVQPHQSLPLMLH